MNENERFMVLLAKPESRDPMPIAKALAAARKTPLQDQVIAAKNGWGVLAENLTEAEANLLVQQLKANGIESISISAATWTSLPEAKPATKWDALVTRPPVLIAAAGITITSKTTKSVKEGPNAAQKVLSTAILLGTGLPIKIGGRERTVEKTQQYSDLVFYVDVLYKEPLQRLRVDAQSFDYSFLKERKLYQVMGNFKLLVADLVKAAPAAWKNHGTQVLLEGKPIQTMGYGSLADLERETRWLFTLMQTREARGSI